MIFDEKKVLFITGMGDAIQVKRVCGSLMRWGRERERMWCVKLGRNLA